MELLVVSGGDELCLDSEGVVSVDARAAGAIGTLSVLLGAFLSHVVLALRSGIAGAVAAGMGSDVEAVWVGLHDVNACALRVVGGHAILVVAEVVDSDGVDTSDATTAEVAKVDSVLESSSSDGRLQNILGSIPRLVLEHDRVVGGNVCSVVAVVDINAGPVLGSEVFLLRAAIDCDGVVLVAG